MNGPFLVTNGLRQIWRYALFGGLLAGLGGCDWNAGLPLREPLTVSAHGLLAERVSGHNAPLRWPAPVGSAAPEPSAYLLGREGMLRARVGTRHFHDQGLEPGRHGRYGQRVLDHRERRSAPSPALDARTPPAEPRCAPERFSFLVFSDTYVGEEAALARLVAWARTQWPELRFFVSAGDTPPYLRVRALLDAAFCAQAIEPLCGALRLPWFPAVGNHDAESVADMKAWARRWVDDPATEENEWQSAPQRSPFARQLPQSTRFVRGPRWVWTRDPLGEQALRELPEGTVYAFDYRGVRFVFLDVYEQGIYEDPFAGVEDGNGSAWHDPRHSQLDWLAEVLAASPRPRATFVFGHVALRAPCYNYDPPDPRWSCPGPPPPDWSEHNSRFRTQALLERLAASGVTAYFHGHDHVPSRLLLAADGRVLRDGRFWQTARGFPPAVAPVAERLAAHSLWQVDAGRLGLGQGSFVHVRVGRASVDFSLYRYRAPDYRYPGDPLSGSGPTLWDVWSVALDQGEEAVRVPPKPRPRCQRQALATISSSAR